VLGRTYPRADGKEPMKVDLCLVDAGWGPLSGDDPPLVPGDAPQGGCASVSRVSTWGRARPRSTSGSRGPATGGATGGCSRPPSAKYGREVFFDANYWKSFVAERCRSPIGAAGTLTVFGGRPRPFTRRFGKHLAAEFPTRVRADGRTVDEWQVKPGRPDNDWLDCLVGCCVGASVLGLSWSSSTAPPMPKKPKRKVDIEELYARA
jgi:hypothetical protein